MNYSEIDQQRQRAFNIRMGQDGYKQHHEIMKEQLRNYNYQQGTDPYEYLPQFMKTPHIKVTLTLKPEQHVESGWMVTLKHEQKIVPENRVCFYCEDLLQAIQAFNVSEVVAYTIEYK